MKPSYDVIIIGGGIAGAVCGKLLSEYGYHCVILEKSDKPYEKICGGWMPFKAVSLLNQYGWNTDRLIEMGGIITSGVIITKGGKTQKYSYSPEEFGIGIRRAVLQEFFMHCAEEAGCEVCYSQNVTEISETEHFYQVNHVTARQLIVTVGTSVLKCMDKRQLYQNQTFGISEIIEAESILEKDTVYFWYPDAEQKSYFWAIPVEKNSWNIGWWSPSVRNLKKEFLTYREIYLLKFRNIKTIIPPRGAVCGSDDRRGKLPFQVCGAGDFAGTNCAESGEGIYFAIRSAIELVQNIRNKEGKRSDGKIPASFSGK